MSAPNIDAETLARDLDFALLAARTAGERGMALRGLERWEGKTLGDVCDQACDGYLHGLLLGRYPDDGVLSEETIDTPERLERSRVWIVDPLDGTKEYAQLRDDWAVHVALVVDGTPVLGAVALPSQGQTWFGICHEANGRTGVETGTPIDTHRGDGDAADTPRIAVSRSHTPEWVERFAENVGGELIGAGSAGNKVAMLLRGEADAYVHQVGLKEWDTCAPEAVARAFGWHVCRLDGTPHRYNQRDPRNHELVVCRPAARARVLEALAASGVLEDRRVS